MTTTYVYFIQMGYSFIKIGVSRDPEGRLRNLQTGSAKPLKLIATLPFGDRNEAFIMEKFLHDKFAHLALAGEWFKRCILRELRVKGKRVIKGTYKNPIPVLHHKAGAS